MKALIVMDSCINRNVIQEVLTWGGYQVSVTESCLAGKKLLSAVRTHFDLIILHVDDGQADETLHMVQDLRTSYQNQMPILLLSKIANPKMAATFFQSGADEYMRCPFEPEELVERIKALNRRWKVYNASLPAGTQDGIRLDLRELKVYRPNGAVSQLTPTECRMLFCLMQRPGRVLSRDEICRSTWNSGDDLSNSVDVYIRRLRKKIEERPAAPRYLITIRGMGYKLVT